MNPTWDLLPFNHLCRVLGRKTNRNPDEYSTWTREKIKQALERYEGTDTVRIEQVGVLSDSQLDTIKQEIKQQVDEVDLALDKKLEEEGKHLQNLRRLVDLRFDRLRDEILTAIKETRRVERKVVVEKSNGQQHELPGRQHCDFAMLLELIMTRQNVFLVGPAGSGKTSAAVMVAAALGLPFFFNGAIDNEYKLLGFIDAQGRVISPAFRKAYSEGGVYLYDELDASLPSAALAFNAALANDMCDFPDGCVKRHADFYCMAAGNTFYGADHHYVGRMKQDGAFLDRFLVLDWHYDTDLERDLGLDLWPDNAPRALAWFNMVVKVREQAALKGLQVIISPRATIGGIKLLRNHVSWNNSVRVTLRKTMKAADWDKIMEFAEEPQSDKVLETWYDHVKKHDIKPWGDYVPKPPEPEPEPEPYFHVKSHGKSHRKFYKDLL